MKRIVLLCLVMLSGIARTSAQTSISLLEDSVSYQIRVGKLTMTVDAGFGGRIRSFAYDGREVLSQSRWPESFGSTFWTSPQKEWNWPPVVEIDKRPYQAELNGGRLTLTSEVAQRMGLRVRKEFSADESDNAVVVAYSIINEGQESRRVAPWEITRVANEGLIFFDSPSDSIWPSGLLNFTSECGVSWYQCDERPQNRKVNADGRGWLAYYGNGLLLVKRFQDLDKYQPAEGEAEIQVYVNRGKTYIELESQGACTLLKPGESLDWTVRWNLLPCDLPAVPSARLVEMLHTPHHDVPSCK